MSDFLTEKVPEMPPMSLRTIAGVAEAVLGEIFPEALQRPTAIDFGRLVDYELQEHGIIVTPASLIEMGDRLGVTDPRGDEHTEVLLREDVWEKLHEGGRIANQARATVGHELGHAILHVPIIRRGAVKGLNRLARQDMRAYCDPEWQGWSFAGCFIAPLRMIKKVGATSAPVLAQTFGVSSAMMQAHLNRLSRAKML